MSMKLEQQQENESTPDVLTLLTLLQLGALSLPNRIVVSPMTRARSTDGVPTDIEVKYYSQHASAGDFMKKYFKVEWPERDSPFHDKHRNGRRIWRSHACGFQGSLPSENWMRPL